MKINQIRFAEPTNELYAPVAEFCAELGLEISESGIPVRISVGERLSVKKVGDGVEISYRNKHEIFRALTFLPSILTDGGEICETGKYDMLCYMVDNSRNAVLNIPTAKKLIRFLAGMGYNSMMLYTEDTYELPDYPYFGYMRGRFTADELKELDDYADSFGIELIPCIQTLAHLKTALRWPNFREFQDTEDILMVGDDRTYQFIRAALKQYQKCLRSRRINLGLDEALMIGRGEYQKQNGYRDPMEVMMEHVDRVEEICREIGYRPMMWGDMVSDMARKAGYFNGETEIPHDMLDRMSKAPQLIHWTYYSMDREAFERTLNLYHRFQNSIAFAGSAFKWYGFGAHNAFSIRTAKMQLDLCEKHGVKDIIVTGWGDNGGEASQFAALPSLLFFAERCYGNSESVNNDWMNRRALDCFGCELETLMAFDLPDSLPEISADVVEKPRSAAKSLLYNDLLERLMDRHMNRANVTEEYARRAQKLLSLANDPHVGYALETLGHLCHAVSLKAEMGWRLHEAYCADDRDTLFKIANDEIPKLLEALHTLLDAFGRQWYRENKTYGFIDQEIRLGGLMTRIESVKRRLQGYLSGDIERIEELECEPLPFDPSRDGGYAGHTRWDLTVFAGMP